MSRKIGMLLVAGTAISLGGLASAQTLKTDSELDLGRAYRAEIKADTARRVSELANGRSGFQIASADGVGTLNVGALVQFRYTANFRDDGASEFRGGALVTGRSSGDTVGNGPGQVTGQGFVNGTGRVGAIVALSNSPGATTLAATPLGTATFAALADNTLDGVFNPTALFIAEPAGAATPAGAPFRDATVYSLAGDVAGVLANQAALDALAVDGNADGIVDTNFANIGVLNQTFQNNPQITGGTTFSQLTAAQRTALNNAFRQSYIIDLRRDIADGTVARRIDDNDFAHGFNVQRARLDFYGNIAIPNFTYRISAEASDIIEGGSNGGAFNVTWAYGQYNFEGGLEGLYARLGIFKAPLFYEELVAPEYQLLAERSIVNEFFSQQYSEGLMFGYEADAFRVNFAITDGLATRGTQYNQAGESDIALTGRADVKFAGDWAQFEDFTSWRGSEFAARAGVAAHWETYGQTAPDNTGAAGATLPTLYTALLIPGDANGSIVSDGDIVAYTADAQVEGNGWNAFAAFYGRYETADLASSNGEIIRSLLGIEEDVNDFGWVVQAGYLVTDQVELFARYEGMSLDEDRFGVLADALNIETDLHFLTVGGNYYFVPESQALKFTTDVIIAFEETGALQVTPNGANRTVVGGSGGNTVTGLLGQTDDTEIAVRAQFQLLF